MEADVPTMHVTESNGEISASVEETNRVRASLGLAPLKEDAGHESAARGNVEERTKAMVKEGEEDALRDKLDSARRQRLLHQKLAGKSLGEQLAGEEMDSAAAWVQKSRGQEEDRKERRKETRAGRKVGGPKAGSSLLSQSARYDEEDEMGQEGATELGGAIVGHSIEDFKAGESVVLTLADQEVVGSGEGGGYALNEDSEMLENVNLAENWRRQKAKDLAKGEGRFSHYEGGPKDILSKYDESLGERKTLKLDATGSVDEAKQKKLAAIKARLAATQGGAAGGTTYDMGDVGMAGRSIADGDDYMSRDEVREQQVTFQKASGSEKGEKKKKKKKLRKKEGGGLDLDAMAAMEAASGKDHGSLVSRAARADGLLAAQLEQDQQRRERFDRALATAEEKSARLERGGAVDAMDVDGAPDGGETVMEEEAEVDVELYAALARARRLKAQESRALAAADVDDAAARRVAAAVERAEEAGPQDDATAGGVELSSLEFSQTGEFCKAVRAKDDQDANIDLPSAKLRAAKELAGNGHPAANSSNLNGAGEAGAAAGGQQVKTEGGAGSSSGVKLELGSGDGNGANGDDDDDDDDDKAEEGFMHEPKASGGLGAVLEMARRRGMLAEERDVAGRVFDQKGAGLHAYDDDGGGKEPTFTLDHYDEYGRKMTEKQAFRQLSWKFHGKAPSKKKMEKRMLEREKQISDRTEDKAMKHMAALQAAQQSTKSAHVVLTGINAIKPSEIKSVRQQAGGEGADVRAKKKAKTG